ncbi:MAG: DNA alkylation repair protein, partial [Ancrocorticia sp.]|uniref:DNA alkylation repair protein n=1 Tax=Ancrocorticia sp. TaxID=2593684 RepID=UPI003F8FC26B
EAGMTAVPADDPFDTAMDGAGLIANVSAAANPEKSGPMAAYMRDQFAFLGVSAAARKPIQRPYFAVARRDQHADWGFVAQCWALPYREFQYVACDYLYAVRRRLSSADLPRIKALASSKQWWDSIDTLTKTVGAIAASESGSDVKEPESSARSQILQWATDDDFWIRRLAILHQLGQKEATDTAALDAILVANFGSDEFFINKAIGWALREYSKTDPTWVAAFIQAHEATLSPLSIREGSKYLDR